MYWVIGGLILVAMTVVLTVANTTAPPSLGLLDLTLWPVLALLTGLLVLSTRKIDTRLAYGYASADQPSKPIANALYYFITALLAIGLITTSALQALISHERAQSTRITQPLRVQALVTVEGLSDSVYDKGSDHDKGSSYRQVLSLIHI